MAIDATSPRTRRQILLGALGGVAASVAAAVGRASPVAAANGQTVMVGQTYSATTETRIDATGAGTAAIHGTSDSGYGIYAGSNSAPGIYGTSDSKAGVRGDSTSSIGVDGQSAAIDQPAIRGWSYNGSTAVQGFSGTGFETPLAAPAKTGVHGYADQDAGAVGLKGQTTLGRGVFGVATTGTGGYFTAGTSGIALRATGRVKLDRATGVATVPQATNSITVTPGTNLTSASAVVATVQGTPSGSLMVQSVAINAAADTFTIYLTANATHATKVAWHVFG